MVVFIEDHLKVQADKLTQVAVCVGVLSTEHWRKWEEERKGNDGDRGRRGASEKGGEG